MELGGMNQMFFSTQINSVTHSHRNSSPMNNTDIMFYNNRFPNVHTRKRNELQKIFPYHLFNKFTLTLTDENINSNLNLHRHMNSSENYLDEHQLFLEKLSHKYKSSFHYGKHFFEKFAIMAKNNTKLINQNKQTSYFQNNTKKGKKKQGRFFNMIMTLVNNKSKRKRYINGPFDYRKKNKSVNNDSNKKGNEIKIPVLKLNNKKEFYEEKENRKKRGISLHLTKLNVGKMLKTMPAVSLRKNEDNFEREKKINLKSYRLSRNLKGDVYEGKISESKSNSNLKKLDKCGINNSVIRKKLNFKKMKMNDKNYSNFKTTAFSLRSEDSKLMTVSPFSIK